MKPVEPHRSSTTASRVNRYRPAEEAAVIEIRRAEAALCEEHRDLWIQCANPSAARHKHDILANDSAFVYQADNSSPDERRFEYDIDLRLGELLASRLIAGPFVSGTEKPGDDSRYEESHREIAELLADAYTKSSEFRRLFNHATKDRAEPCWYLRAEGPVSANPASTQHGQATSQNVITLCLDAWLDGVRHPTYMSANGLQDMSPVRGYLHPLISALTLLPDEEADHPRGPNIEYVNLVCKQLGCLEPACTLYEPVDTETMHAPMTAHRQTPPLVYFEPEVVLVEDVAGAFPSSPTAVDVERAMEVDQTPVPLDLSMSAVSVLTRATHEARVPDAPIAQHSVTPRMTFDADPTVAINPFALCGSAMLAPDISPERFRPNRSRLLALSGGHMRVDPEFQREPTPLPGPSQSEAVAVMASLAEPARTDAGGASTSASAESSRSDVSRLSDHCGIAPESEIGVLDTAAKSSYADDRVQMLDAMRNVTRPYLHATGAANEGEKNDFAEFITNRTMRNTVVESWTQRGPAVLPRQVTRWWLELLHGHLHSGPVAARQALALLTEPCGRYDEASFAAGLVSCARHYPDETALLVRVLRAVANNLEITPDRQDGAAQVRRALVRSRSSSLTGAGSSYARKNLYEWIKDSTSVHVHSLAGHLGDLDLVPNEAEYTKAGLVHRVFLIKSPHARLIRRFEAFRRSPNPVALPMIRDLQAIARDVTAVLSDDCLAMIDREVENRRSAIAKKEARYVAEQALRASFADHYLKTWTEQTQQARSDLRFVAMGAHFVDKTGAYRDAYFTASNELREKPSDFEVRQYVDERMKDPDIEKMLREFASGVGNAKFECITERGQHDPLQAGAQAATLQITETTARASSRAAELQRRREASDQVGRVQRELKKRTLEVQQQVDKQASEASQRAEADHRRRLEALQNQIKKRIESAPPPVRPVFASRNEPSLEQRFEALRRQEQPIRQPVESLEQRFANLRVRDMTDARPDSWIAEVLGHAPKLPKLDVTDDAQCA